MSKFELEQRVERLGEMVAYLALPEDARGEVAPPMFLTFSGYRKWSRKS